MNPSIQTCLLPVNNFGLINMPQALLLSFLVSKRQSLIPSTCIHELFWFWPYDVFVSQVAKLDPLSLLQVLLWLKQWDSFALGSQIIASIYDVLFALRRCSSLAQHQKKFADGRNSYSKNSNTSLGSQFVKQSNPFSQGDGTIKVISEF